MRLALGICASIVLAFNAYASIDASVDASKFDYCVENRLAQNHLITFKNGKALFVHDAANTQNAAKIQEKAKEECAAKSMCLDDDDILLKLSAKFTGYSKDYSAQKLLELKDINQCVTSEMVRGS